MGRGWVHPDAVAVRAAGAAAWLLARLIAQLSADLLLGICTGLRFLLNITHFQAVHHISALDYPLALCLAIATLLYWNEGQHKSRLLFTILFSLALLTHLSTLFIWPLVLALSWRHLGALPALRHLGPTLILPGAAMLASMALTSRGTSTWRSLEAYAIQSPLDLALGALGSLAWVAGRRRTTAQWLPLPLYDHAPWELWCGLLISLGLALLALYGPAILRWAAAWTLLGLLPFVLLTSGTILGLPAGPARYLYLASAGSSLLLS